jgi:hypothetical protein
VFRQEHDEHHAGGPPTGGPVSYTTSRDTIQEDLMATLYHQAELEVSAAVAWDFLERYTRSEVHIFSSCTSERQVEDYRVVTTQDGQEIWERNVSVDSARMRAVYTIPGLLGSEHHQAEMRVLDQGDGKAVVVWITDFLPHKLVDDMRDGYAVLFGELLAAVNQHKLTS